jgi:hypothetical protein
MGLNANINSVNGAKKKKEMRANMGACTLQFHYFSLHWLLFAGAQVKSDNTECPTTELNPSATAFHYFIFLLYFGTPDLYFLYITGLKTKGERNNNIRTKHTWQVSQRARCHGKHIQFSAMYLYSIIVPILKVLSYVFMLDNIFPRVLFVMA